MLAGQEGEGASLRIGRQAVSRRGRPVGEPAGLSRSLSWVVAETRICGAPNSTFLQGAAGAGKQPRWLYYRVSQSISLRFSLRSRW